MSETPEILPGEHVATVGSVRYVLAHGIFAVHGATLLYYCKAGEWPESAAAKEHARLERIAELEAELAQLRAAGPLLPAEPEKPKRNYQRRVVEAPAPVVAAAVEAPAPLACPHCDRTDLKNAKALAMHLWRAHKVAPADAAGLVALANGGVLAPVDAPETAPPAAVPPPPPGEARGSGLTTPTAIAPPPPAKPAWVCATCGATTGRAVSDPTRCKACVRAANGVPAPQPRPADRPFQCACNGAFSESLEQPGKCIRCTGEYAALLAA